MSRKKASCSNCIIAMLTIILFSACSSFENSAKPLFKNLKTLNELSILKCKTTQEVWSKAIFDHRYALSTSTNFDDYYVNDFNVAIARMEEEADIKFLNKKIDSFSKIVVENVAVVNGKSDESYDKLITLYTNVIALSKTAISPSGNLQSFAKEVNERESEINLLITELSARNPTFEK